MTKTTRVIALASSARTFYEANPVTEDVKSLLEETAVFLIGVTRRSTEEAFELGERLERAAALLPEGTLEKWAVERCGYTARHVRTQRAVFRNLARYKDILVELAVGPTVLGKLSTAEPEQIEQAIGFAAQNGKLRVQDVTAIMTGSKTEVDPKPQVDPYDVGDIDGLKAIIAIKVQDGLKSFLGHLGEIHKHAKEALNKKNIVKSTLAKKTHLTARLAHRELESLAQFVGPYPTAAYVISPSPLPGKTGWAAVSALLYKMGSETTWPDKPKLRAWLETEVVPVLEWAGVKSKDPVSATAGKASTTANLSPVQVDASAMVDDPKRRQDDEASVPASPEADTVNDETVKRLQAMLVPFGAKVTMEAPAPSNQSLPDASIPSLDEALAEPPKAFKRPAFLKPKAVASKPDDGAASAA